MRTPEHTVMDAKALIDAARAEGVQLWTEGRKLRFRAPPHVLTDELRQALREHREQVIDALLEEAATPTPGSHAPTLVPMEVLEF